MGKYSNVNTNSLLNKVTTALNELNSHSLGNEYNSLCNANVLSSGAFKPVRDTFVNIANSKNYTGSIYNLEMKLNNLGKATQYIQKYQEIEKIINNLEKKLYKNGKKDNGVQSQIDGNKRNLLNYEKKIDNLLS